MKHAQLNPAAALALAAATSASLQLAAGDWPEYRGPSHDGRSAEKISRAWSADGPRQLWKVPATGGFSSFVVGGERCFTIVLRDKDGAPMETLVALDADTGKEVWSAPLEAAKYDGGGNSGTDKNNGGDGPRTTPAFDGDKVYTFSGKLVVQCFNAANGSVVWTRDLMKEHGGRKLQWQNAQSPVIDGDRVFVAGGGPGESLLALNKKDGSVAWKAFDEKQTHATCVPATILGQRQVIYFLQSGLLSVDPATGKELWRHPHKYAVSTAASPVVAGDIVYCSSGYGVGGGAARISKDGGAWKATPLYFKEGNKALANHWSTPVLHEGHLYGMFQFKEYGNGPVKCVDIATGEIKWERPGFGPGQVIFADGCIVALADDGRLVLIEATPSGYKELASSDVLDGKCWSTPVLANGRIYARSTKEAVCVEVGAKTASR